MRGLFPVLTGAVRTVRLPRLVLLLLVSLLAGLACDWFRPAERLMWPKPLPVFTTTPATR